MADAKKSTQVNVNTESTHKNISLLRRLGGYLSEASEIISTEFEAVSNALDRSQAVIEFEPDGKILRANENFLNTVGYSIEEVVGKHHKMFVAPELARSADYATFWKRLAAGEFLSDEFPRVGKGGEKIWLQASYNPILDESGKVIKVIKFATNITEAKQLSANHSGQIDAINRAQAVIEFAPDGTILHANENFLSAMGYSEREAVGQHHKIFVDDEYSRSAEYANFWKRLREGKFESNQFQRFAKDGSVVWIQASYNPIFGADGELVKVVKFATDITEQKIQSAEDRGLVRAINRAQAVIQFDTNGYILDANDNFTATVGYSKNEIVGQHHQMFVDPDYARSAEYSKFWENLRNGQFQAAEYQRFGKGGKEIWLQATYNPIFDPSGELVKVVKLHRILQSKFKSVSRLNCFRWLLMRLIMRFLLRMPTVSQNM